MSLKKRYFDMIKQTPLAGGFLVISGTVTYILILIIKWIADISGAVGAWHTLISAVGVFVGLAVLVAASYMYIQKIGANDVIFLKDNKVPSDEMKPHIGAASVAFLAAIAVYGIAVFALYIIDWEFISGPSAHISAALNLRWGTPLDGVAMWCRLAGFFTTAVFLFPAMLAGYIKGFHDKKLSVKN